MQTQYLRFCHKKIVAKEEAKINLYIFSLRRLSILWIWVIMHQLMSFASTGWNPRCCWWNPISQPGFLRVYAKLLVYTKKLYHHFKQWDCKVRLFKLKEKNAHSTHGMPELETWKVCCDRVKPWFRETTFQRRCTQKHFNRQFWRKFD